MIIVGYQGVGKSTLAGKGKFIDLESGSGLMENVQKIGMSPIVK